METVTLKVGELGVDERFEMRNILNTFVKENFELLYAGSCRLKSIAIPEDSYTGRRIQINNTRLHFNQNLKCADGHRYDDDCVPTERQLRITITDLQSLLDIATKNIHISFELKIIQRGYRE